MSIQRVSTKIAFEAENFGRQIELSQGTATINCQELSLCCGPMRTDENWHKENRKLSSDLAIRAENTYAYGGLRSAPVSLRVTP
jgi:hypothetical protein